MENLKQFVAPLLLALVAFADSAVLTAFTIYTLQGFCFLALLGLVCMVREGKTMGPSKANKVMILVSNFTVVGLLLFGLSAPFTAFLVFATLSLYSIIFSKKPLQLN